MEHLICTLGLLTLACSSPRRLVPLERPEPVVIPGAAIYASALKDPPQVIVQALPADNADAVRVALAKAESLVPLAAAMVVAPPACQLTSSMAEQLEKYQHYANAPTTKLIFRLAPIAGTCTDPAPGQEVLVMRILPNADRCSPVEQCQISSIEVGADGTVQAPRWSLLPKETTATMNESTAIVTGQGQYSVLAIHSDEVSVSLATNERGQPVVTRATQSALSVTSPRSYLTIAPDGSVTGGFLKDENGLPHGRYMNICYLHGKLAEMSMCPEQ